MITGYTGLKDEELVELAKAGSEEAFIELLEATKGIRYKVARSFLNIPRSELEDLISEGALETYKAIFKFDHAKHTAFKSFLYQDLNRLYITIYDKATAQSRLGDLVAIPADQDDERDRNSGIDRFFSVSCEEYELIELLELLNSLPLSVREREAIDLLIAGYSKPDIAVKMGVKTPAVHNYIKRVGAKISACY